VSITDKRKPYKRIALVLSVCLCILWGILGTGASLAWFSDTSSEIKNIFHTAEFKLEVSYRLSDGTYKKIDGQTPVFDDQARYEPGYVQVVYLKIENKGTVPFDLKTAVNVTDYTVATNAYGQRFNLQDYLKFGLTTASEESALNAKVANRDLAKNITSMKLGNYSTDVTSLDAGKVLYMALVVSMPEEVGNEANYRGTEVPKVELGIIFSATQQTN